MSRRRHIPRLIILLAACGHSDSFTPVVPVTGSLDPTADIQLTHNSDQDYWPAWTEDGQAILYAFVEPNAPQHRCIGLLAPQGGTRLWTMCHTAATYADSTSSFPGYALGNDGRLLYLEAVGAYFSGVPIPVQAAPREITLWLADSSAPFLRTPLLTMPLHVGGAFISWLTDIAWTGPTTFIALGQAAVVQGHCPATPFSRLPICEYSDTVFGGAIASDIGDAGIVVRGTIAGGRATLTAVDGTAGATAYSFAENGATIVFTRKEDMNIYRVPVTGGSPVVAGPLVSPIAPGYELLGIACRLSTCLVSADSVTFVHTGEVRINAAIHEGSRELWSFSLNTGAGSVIANFTTVISTMAVSPLSGDIVLQIGGSWGHLQTFAGSTPADLHLLPGIVK